MARTFPDWTYHFSVDDNIIFLEDLAKGGHASLFDQPYLGFWREMHERYGARVQLNIHGKRSTGFSLDQLPETYKSEWVDNADWLRLTFHQMEDPKGPFSYDDSTYEEAKRDYLQVTEEIVRFAGPELVSPFTTIHHAAGTKDVCRAWRDCGVKGLIAATWLRPDGQFHHGYYLDDAQVAEVGRRGILKDEETGLQFISHDVPLHRSDSSADAVVERVQSILADPDHWPHVKVIHEEWALVPSDPNFVPDAKERTEAVLSFLHSSGIRPVFFEEILSS